MEISVVKIIKWTAALIMAGIAVLTPFHPLFIACGCLIIIDTITGIMRAYRISEAITSRSFSRIVAKFVQYGLAILTGAILEKYFTQDIPTARIIATSIATNEGMSILENIQVVTGIDFWSAIKSKMINSKENDK